MKFTASVPSACVLVVLFAGGCSSTQMAGPSIQADASAVSANTPVALATLGPAEAPRAQSRAFSLGAGDPLGQAIYANYAAVARANAGWQYASGSTLE